MLTIEKKITLKQNYSIIVGQNKQKEVSRSKILFSFYAIFQTIAVLWIFLMHDYKQMVGETFDIQYNLLNKI